MILFVYNEEGSPGATFLPALRKKLVSAHLGASYRFRPKSYQTWSILLANPARYRVGCRVPSDQTWAKQRRAVAGALPNPFASA